MEIGVIIRLKEGVDIDEKFKKLSELGIKTCQLNIWEDNLKTDEVAEKVMDAQKKYGIKTTAFWCGWEGRAIWNFYEGPLTLGIVPREYRFARIKSLKLGSDFAKKIGVKDVVTHLGFLPENPCSAEFFEIVSAIRDVAEYCKQNDQYFLFETGQETPVTLLRTIEEVGTGNLGVNLDPANFILYGKANPVDSLDIIGKFVRGVHAKDGKYPTNGRELGKEYPLGEGDVNFPEFIKKLKKVGYKGALTIEREISGEKQIKDIMNAKKLLESLI